MGTKCLFIRQPAHGAAQVRRRITVHCFEFSIQFDRPFRLAGIPESDREIIDFAIRLILAQAQRGFEGVDSIGIATAPRCAIPSS